MARAKALGVLKSRSFQLSDIKPGLTVSYQGEFRSVVILTKQSNQSADCKIRYKLGGVDGNMYECYNMPDITAEEMVEKLNRGYEKCD